MQVWTLGSIRAAGQAKPYPLLLSFFLEASSFRSEEKGGFLEGGFPKGPKIETIQDLENVKRDWNFKRATHQTLFFVGNSQGQDWTFQARLKFQARLQFQARLFFSIFGPLGFCKNRRLSSLWRSECQTYCWAQYSWYFCSFLGVTLDAAETPFAKTPFSWFLVVSCYVRNAGRCEVGIFVISARGDNEAPSEDWAAADETCWRWMRGFDVSQVHVCIFMLGRQVSELPLLQNWSCCCIPGLGWSGSLEPPPNTSPAPLHKADWSWLNLTKIG